MNILSILTKIKDFIVKNPTFSMGIIIIVLIMLLFKQCGDKRAIEKNANQNYHAMNDSIKKYKNKAGEMTFEKAMYQMTEKDLEKYKPELYKELKKNKGTQFITKTEYVYRDTGSTKFVVSKLSENTYGFPFIYTSNDTVLSIKGKGSFYAEPYIENDKAKLKVGDGTLTMEDIKMKFGLTLGIKEDKGIKKVIVTPSTTQMEVTKLESAEVDKALNSKTKPKKFGVGFGIGYGICLSKTGQVYYGPTIGLSLSYNIIRF